MPFDEQETQSPAQPDTDALQHNDGHPHPADAHSGAVEDASNIAASDAPLADTPDTPSPESLDSPESEKPGGKMSFWRRCPVTTVFVALMALAYGLTTYQSGFQHPSEQALIWGAFIPDAIRAGEWWRYFTVALLHANPGHIGINAFMTLAFGNLLEPSLGSRRLLLLYLIALMGSGAASYWMDTPGIGASGIGYGLIGAYMGIIIIIGRRRQPETFGKDLRGLIFFVALFVGSNLMDPHINLWAHLGGFFSGLVFAVLLLGGRSPAGHPQP